MWRLPARTTWRRAGAAQRGHCRAPARQCPVCCRWSWAARQTVLVIRNSPDEDPFHYARNRPPRGPVINIADSSRAVTMAVRGHGSFQAPRRAVHVQHAADHHGCRSHGSVEAARWSCRWIRSTSHHGRRSHGSVEARRCQPSRCRPWRTMALTAMAPLMKLALLRRVLRIEVTSPWLSKPWHR